MTNWEKIEAEFRERYTFEHKLPPYTVEFKAVSPSTVLNFFREVLERETNLYKMFRENQASTIKDLQAKVKELERETQKGAK